MSVINPPSLFYIQGVSSQIVTTPITITRPWKSRLAGTAFVEITPMQGLVLALALDGPTVVGSAEINPDGSWEILDIAKRYENTDLVVIGVARTPNTNFAIANRVRTVA